MPTKITSVNELSDAALMCRRSAVRHNWVERRVTAGGLSADTTQKATTPRKTTRRKKAE
jgi:hypothetical protein